MLGGGGVEEFLTPEEKKRLEEDRKKRLQDLEGSAGTWMKPKAVPQDLGVAAVLAGLLQGGGGLLQGGGGLLQGGGGPLPTTFLQGAAGSVGGSNLLSLLAAGGKPKKRGLNKTNSPCFACQNYGHWADDPECPLQTKKNKAEKKVDVAEG